MQLANKGIVKYASSFRLFGISFFWLGILYKACHEGRFVELVVSAFYMLQSRREQVEYPLEHAGVEAHTEMFYTFNIIGARPLRARAQSVYSDESITVAGEYAWPGTRILVRRSGRDKIHDVYGNDRKICHIHAIAYVGSNELAVTTGDSRKVFDLIRLEELDQISYRRVISHCAGYSALALLEGAVWGGSDFSERANFLINITDRRKYFLPAKCAQEYVIDLKPIDGSRLLLISRRLGTDRGNALIFDLKKRKFTAANAVHITEKDLSWSDGRDVSCVEC